MTERECRRLVREDTLPVILGNGFAALRLALRLQILYGLSPLLCAPTRGVAGRLMPTAYLPLVAGDARLLREQLSDLADRYEDGLLLLIPATGEELSRLGSETEELETNYVLIAPEEISDLLSPLSLKKI